MSARDPLRARLPRGFQVPTGEVTPRLVWGGTLGLAVLVALVLLSLCGGRISCGVPQSPEAGPLPLHPASGTTAVIALWSDPGFPKPMAPGEVPPENSPLRVAFWPDGTIIWGTGDAVLGGRPYRTAHVPPSVVLSLASRVRAAIERLPREERSDVAVDASYQELAAVADGAYVRLRCMGGVETEPASSLGLVWRDASALMLAAIPAQGDPMALEGVNFVFVR